MITFILPWLLKEWRYITGILLIIGLYLAIYHRGYASCEKEVADAKKDATISAQNIADQEKKEIIADNLKESEYSKYLEGQLDADIKKKIYSNCVVTSRGVYISNKHAQ